MTDNFDEAKEQQGFQEPEDDTYYIQASRAQLYYEDGMDEPVEADENGVPVEGTPDNAEVGDDLELDLDLATETQETITPVVPDEASDEYKAFNENFKAIAGVDYKTAVTEFESAKAELQQLKVEHQKLTLQSEWGNDYDSRLTQVVEQFARLPEEKKKELDNAEGAKRIWAAIEKANAKKEKQVPELQRSSTKVPAGSQPKYMFSAGQISKMSNAEYTKNAAKIQYAYANGLVKR